jgi:hypothetical protein
MRDRVRFPMIAGSAQRALLRPVAYVAAGLLLLDDIVRPFYRPLLLWIARRRIVQRAEAAIGRLPPYMVLALFAVPFAITEPLKLFGLFLLGTGRPSLAMPTLVIAHGASFLIVERVYRAGRGQLMTIPWFAAIVGAITHVRDAMLARLRATRVWSAAIEAASRIRRLVAGVRRRR